jgi:hypothetical protein
MAPAMRFFYEEAANKWLAHPAGTGGKALRGNRFGVLRGAASAECQGRNPFACVLEKLIGKITWQP